MKKFLAEFKEFAMRGNVVDLAIGVVIGAAFGKVVTAVVDIFLNPIIETFTANLPEGSTPGFAGSLINFAGVLVEFIITAFILFLIVKGINKFKKPAPAPEAPNLCPFCKQEVSKEATRCPFCTSELQYKPQ